MASAGSIEWRGKKSGRFRYSVPNPDTGQPERRALSFTGLDKKAAEIELRRLLSEADKGGDVQPRTITLAEFLKRWLEDSAPRTNSPKTCERYGELIDNQINPSLGHQRLQRLMPYHFDRLYTRLLTEGRTYRNGRGHMVTRPPVAPRTVVHVHRLLHRALGVAVVWQWLAVNPIGKVEPPKVEQDEVVILTADVVPTVPDKLAGEAIRSMVLTALGSGVRRGELVAFRWRDAQLGDFAKPARGGVLSVNQSLEETRKGGLRFKPAKTRSGRRSIPIDAELVAVLRQHWRDQQAQRLAAGVGRAGPDDLIFPKVPGSPWRPSKFTTEWDAAARRAGLADVNVHALRHTFASQKIAAGVDVVRLSKWMGHSSPVVTLRVYAHLFEKRTATMEAETDANRAPWLQPTSES